MPWSRSTSYVWAFTSQRGTMKQAWQHHVIYPWNLRSYTAYLIIRSGSRFTMNSNPKWIRLTLDTPKVIRFAKWIWTEIHCESWSRSDNRIAPQSASVTTLSLSTGGMKQFPTSHASQQSEVVNRICSASDEQTFQHAPDTIWNNCQKGLWQIVQMFKRHICLNKHNCVLSNAGLSNAPTKTGICTSPKSDLYFRFHSPLNTKSALLNFICTWDLVLICWKMWWPEPESCQNAILHTPKIGKLLPVCLTKKTGIDVTTYMSCAQNLVKIGKELWT